MIALIIIPILSILLTVYISNIISFSINNDINTILTLCSILGILLLTLILPNSLRKMFKKSYFVQKLSNKANILCVYIFFLLLFLYGISLIINGVFYAFKILKIFIGIFIILLFIYANILIFKKY